MNTNKKTNNCIETLSVISHEIKTPLNLIAATARIAVMRVNNGSLQTSELEDYFKNIINNCNKIELMLNNVISSSSGQVCQYELLNAEDFAKKFSDMIKYYGENLNFTFSAVAKSDKPLNIPVVTVERIILNLVTNAVKYNSKDEKKVTLEITSGKDCTKFSVKDNGDGIAPINVEKVTEKFFRCGSINVSGMGIGLYLVKSLVTELGGTLEIKSKQKKGTEVIFTIPDNLTGEITMRSSDYTYNPSKSTFDIEFSTLYAN